MVQIAAGYSDKYLKELSYVNKINRQDKAFPQDLFAEDNDKKWMEILELAKENNCQDIHITLSEEDSVTVQSTYCIENGFVSPYMVTNQKLNCVEYENPYVLIFDGMLDSINALLPIFEQLLTKGDKLIIFTKCILDEVLKMICGNILRGIFQACVVEIKSGKTLRNVASDLQSPVFSENEELKAININDIVKVQKMTSFQDNTYLFMDNYIYFKKNANILKVSVKEQSKYELYEKYICDVNVNKGCDFRTQLELEKYNKDNIYIEKSTRITTNVKYLSALRINKGYVSEVFTYDKQGCIAWSYARLLIISEMVESLDYLLPIFEQLVQYNIPLILISERFSKEIIETVTINVRKNIFQCGCVEVFDRQCLLEIAETLGTSIYYKDDVQNINVFDMTYIPLVRSWRDRTFLVLDEYAEDDTLFLDNDNTKTVEPGQLVLVSVGGINLDMQNQEYNYWVEKLLAYMNDF